MRPSAMIWFDRLYLSAMAFDLAYLLLILPRLEGTLAQVPAAAQLGLDFWSVFNGLILTFFVLLALWFCVSRWRNRFAKWALTLLVISVAWSNLSNGAGMFLTEGPMVVALSVGKVALSVAAVVCLHLPQARAWFARLPA